MATSRTERRPRSTLSTTSRSTRSSTTRRGRSATPFASSCARTCSTTSATGSRRACFPRELITELGKLGLLGMHLDGYGLPGSELRRLRADLHGARGRRRRRAQRGVGAGLAGDVPDLEVGLRGAEGALAAADAHAARWSAASASPSPMPARIPASMRTHARRDGSDWILNGAKMWITNGSIADIAIVWARTDDGAIRGFIVEKDMPGFSAPEIHKKLSLRASVTSELVLQDVRVPDENALPGRRRSAARSRASTRRASGSSSAPSARRVRASSARSTTRRSASSSASRSPATSSRSRSSPRWRSRSTARRSSRSISGA